MPYGLIFLGVFLALVGLGAIAAGAPSWALGLGLGSALIQSGAMGLVGGFLLVGIGFVLRALQDVSRRIDRIAPNAGPSVRAAAPPAVPARPVQKREPVSPPAPARREPPPFPTREEFPLRDDLDEPTSRDEADRDDYAEPEERPTRSWPPLTEPKNPDRSFLADSDQRRERPRFAPDRPVPSDPFDAQGSKPTPRNTSPNTSTTIVRSGIIGGMAYTLYNDGSIEAELPIGTVRFASVEELQDHVSHTGEDADVDFNDPKSRAN
jgi:hypothetical protein